MYVTKLVADRWIGQRCQFSEKVAPSWNDIEQSIKALDGHHQSMVTLHGQGQCYMQIGGGEHERYVAYVAAKGDQFHYLASDANEKDVVRLSLGGQEGEYPSNIVTEQTIVLAAARVFSESGLLDPGCKWKNE
jgi:hypothetical protein